MSLVRIPPDSIIARNGTLTFRGKPPADITFVMISNPKCQACKNALVQYSQMPAKTNSAAFGVLDLNAALVNASRTTNSPIGSTPTFFIFHKGGLIARCGTNPQTRTVAGFMDTLKRIQNKINNDGDSREDTPVYTPDFDNKPQVHLRGGHKGQLGTNQPGMYETNRGQLDTPEFMPPYNAPWKAEFRTVGN